MNRRLGILRNGVIALGVVLLSLAHASRAADRMNICLNWAPGADHAPLYFARSQGWFADIGLATTLQAGGGSADALRKLSDGECDAAIADFNAFPAGSPRPPLAVFAIFLDSPLAFYAIAPRKLDSLADLRNVSIGADPRELARRLWPTLTARDPSAGQEVRWVELPNNAKVDALASGLADIVANSFYHHAVEFARTFGPTLQVMHWRDHGVNPYSNVLAVSVDTAVASPDMTGRLVQVVQRAYRACVREVRPCLDALMAANPHLDRDAESAKWEVAAPLVAPSRLSGQIIGFFDPGRIEGGAAGPNPRYSNQFLAPVWQVP
ncbi:MAG: ABC transporter substrate-binding protein [Betaproteobacteria bacterium]|jgi:NitT/TauT family transport system substrate-binding protein